MQDNSRWIINIKKTEECETKIQDEVCSMFLVRVVDERDLIFTLQIIQTFHWIYLNQSF